MEKAYQLADKILMDINDYSEKYVNDDGKTVVSEDAIMVLNNILQEGFTLHKYMVEKKLYEGKPEIEVACLELGKYMEKLQINPENADKLTLSSALQLWNQCKLLIAVLACNILDFKDSLN